MISGCTDKNVHTTGLSDHLLFDHYRSWTTGAAIVIPVLTGIIIAFLNFILPK